MKAIIYDKRQSPTLTMREVARPVPGPGQVLVRLHNTALNAADYRSMAMGIIPRSKIFGADVAGVVEAVGSGVGQFEVGSPVFGDLSGVGFGGLAEYAAAPETAFALKPDGVSFVQAAAVPMAALTALQGLRERGEIQPGKKVLIYGAGGGVGTFAVQLARHFGAQVTAVGGPGSVEVVRSLGPDRVIDYTKEDITHSGLRFDLVLIVNGSRPLGEYKSLLAPRGICVVVGGALSQVLKTMLFGPFLSIGDRKIRLLAAKPNSEDLRFVIGLVEEGKLTPLIDRVYPLEQAAEAVAYLRQGHARGKVVLSIYESEIGQPGG
jgi:NADPH:quinone reductase-like Zn-dependent oxidoreductase